MSRPGSLSPSPGGRASLATGIVELSKLSSAASNPPKVLFLGTGVLSGAWEASDHALPVASGQ